LRVKLQARTESVATGVVDQLGATFPIIKIVTNHGSRRSQTTNAPPSGLTPVVMDLTLRIMGDKSPKAAHTHASQKHVKARAAKQKKNNAASAKQVPNTKK